MSVFKSRVFIFNSYEYFLEHFIRTNRREDIPELTPEQKKELLSSMHYTLIPTGKGDGFYWLYYTEGQMYDGFEEWEYTEEKAMSYGGIEEAYERLSDIIIPDYFEEDEDYMEDFMYKLYGDSKENEAQMLYALDIWGGFFDKENVEIHGLKEKYFRNRIYTSKDERDIVAREIQKQADDLRKKGRKYSTVVIRLAEGYGIDTPVICHRISEYKGERVHTQDRLFNGTSYETAIYHFNNWYPGNNDYPFGLKEEEIDDDGFPYNPYKTDDFKIIKEWVTGAFDTENY